ncbi:MAG: phosphocholine cytidylyltransferase family protein [Deltaproteobacteria bacterium]|nr:phosphocholine cytidylyltransferase family protein [Deltaproteobacteria bacterium]
MKAIIVAAGMGRRLGSHTAEIPKCMVDVAGTSILQRQVDALRAAAVDEINVVRGYLGDRITVPGLRFFDNPDFRDNNILASLFFAAPVMAGGFVFSYSDILYDATVTRALVAAAGDYRLIIDRGWHRSYAGRTDHPVSEGELTLVEGGLVKRVGKGLVSPEVTVGEFIGLAYFSAAAAARLLAEHARLRAARGDDAPFGTARTLRKAYLTDMLNHLIDQGAPMTPVFIDGHWREIDTVEDLLRVRQELDF